MSEAPAPGEGPDDRDCEQRRIEAERLLDETRTQHLESQKALERQNQYLAALHETTLALISHHNLDELLTAIVSRAAQLFETSSGYIYLRSDDGAVLECRILSGVFSQIEVPTLKPGEGLAGRIWQTGQPMVINDYENWPGRVRSYGYKAIDAILGAPLVVNGNVVGVLGVAYDYQSGRAFSEAEIELLTRFAQLAAIALENARLYTAAQQELAERKRAEEELQRAKEAAEAANRAKSTFLDNMSHELRTPLSHILNYVEIVIEDATDLGQQQLVPDLQKVLSAGNQLARIVGDILDISKIEAGKMQLALEELDIAQLAREAAAQVTPLAEKNGNTLQLSSSEGPVQVHADKKKVYQILLNLLTNACKFTKHGQITLSLELQPAGAAGAERVAISVADTGIGMTPEQQRQIFQPFTQADSSSTRKYGGTGLGLAISHHFCEMMGGTIEVQSESGQGSTFTVRLPARVVDPRADTQTHLPHDAALVLIVDDDADSCKRLARLINKQGLRVQTAASGEEGLRQARALRPSLITLDIMLPDMDGWAVLQTLKQDAELRDIPVVLISVVDERRQGFDLGASDYLLKPVDRARLAATLKKLVASPA